MDCLKYQPSATDLSFETSGGSMSARKNPDAYSTRMDGAPSPWANGMGTMDQGETEGKMTYLKCPLLRAVDRSLCEGMCRLVHSKIDHGPGLQATVRFGVL